MFETLRQGLRTEPTTLLVGRHFDGREMRDGPCRIELNRGRIERVEPLLDGVPASPSPGDGSGVLDLRQRTLLPGLINTHVHIARGGMFAPLEPLSLDQVAMNLRATLAAGVTTVGEMGCSAPLVAALRAKTERDPRHGPSIVAAGPLLTAEGGYPLDWLPKIYARLGVALACGDEAAACAHVARLRVAGMDHIKLALMSLSYAKRPLPHVEVPVAKAVVAEAHRLGLRVLAHAHSNHDYGIALDAGVDALMHSSFEPLDATTIARIRDDGVRVCPTLWVFESTCLGAEKGWHCDGRYASMVRRPVRSDWRRFAEAWAESGDVVPDGIAGGVSKAEAVNAVRVAASNLMLLVDAGVEIGFGNDAAYGYSVHARPVDELCAMERAGLDTKTCLRAATTGAASLLGLTDRGRIAAGMRADFVAIDGDPIADLASVERVRTVIHRGRVVGSSRIDTTGQHIAAVIAGLRGTARTAIAGLLGPGGR